MSQEILHNIATRLAVPPYFVFSRDQVAFDTASDYSDLELMAEDELRDLIRYNAIGVAMTFPLSFRLPKAGATDWLIPNEPMQTVTGRHILTKRQVSKGAIRGSVKERWSLDDYAIKIEGVLIGEGDRYPEEAVRQLRAFCEAGEVIATSPFLELWGISRLIIESWEIPHTSGSANQNYRLSCLSDDVYKLLLR